MRKLFLFKTIVFMFCVIAIGAGIAQAESFLRLASTRVHPGETVTIPVTLEADASTSALSTDITFDPGIFEFKSAEPGPAAQQKTAVFHQLSAGLVRIALYSLDNIEMNNGVVLNVILTVKPGTKPGNTEIRHTPSGSTPEGQDAPIDGGSGRITVVPKRYHK